MVAAVLQWEDDAEKPKTSPCGCFNRRADDAFDNRLLVGALVSCPCWSNATFLDDVFGL